MACEAEVKHASSAYGSTDSVIVWGLRWCLSVDTIQTPHVRALHSAQAKLKAAPGMERKHPGVTAAGAGGGVPAATGWQKPAAKGAKKKGKGRKADAAMLGFAAGLDYNAFERPET